MQVRPDCFVSAHLEYQFGFDVAVGSLMKMNSSGRPVSTTNRGSRLFVCSQFSPRHNGVGRAGRGLLQSPGWDGRPVRYLKICMEIL